MKIKFGFFAAKSEQEGKRRKKRRFMRSSGRMTNPGTKEMPKYSDYRYYKESRTTMRRT
jgi:IMP dehydrogenase/GMP reductase